MVQASTFLIAAAFVIAHVLAAPAPALPPVTPESSAVTRRSIDNTDSLLDIEAREPSFWGNIAKGAQKVAPKKVAPKVQKVAPLIRRDEEDNVYVRELGADELAHLEAREPGFFKKLISAKPKVAKVAHPVTGHIFRELDDGIHLEQRE
ncbi:hypothetical protein EST38_g4333 [Candolleomyces aberdarensis]|uniref:Uncharacterized protein n=1 Tax=Candolleomyces aberdarensis TaxID=2316362 RepID=A0A4Q2DPZ5_9AGAR|nr:hypothetical protein EST38_g4333 [Candolleomyces aberdarensis]